MRIERAILAFFQGLILCFTVAPVRRLALLPWLLGIITYPIALYLAYYFHGSVVEAFVSETDGIIATLLYGLTWFAVSVILFVLALFASVLLVLICTAAFQTAIVEQVLKHERQERGLEFSQADENSNIGVIIKQSLGAIVTESVKFLWLIPLLSVAFILGFIPLLTPIAFVLTAWLLAFQFIDIVLDVARFSATRRIRYTARHWIAACSFGLVITFVFLIPFAGMLLGPIATAGAAWMLADEATLWEK